MRRVTKSRNGCARCKGHRLKCDEAKPACGRCTRLGVPCPGYIKPPLKWSTKHEAFQSNKPADKKDAEAENENNDQESVDAVKALYQSIAGGLPEDMQSELPARSMITDGRPSAFSGVDLGNIDFDTPLPGMVDDFSLQFTDDPLFGFLDTTSNPQFSFSQFTFPQPSVPPPSVPSPGFIEQQPASPYYERSRRDSTSSAASSRNFSNMSLVQASGQLQSFSPPTKGLTDTSSVLVEYYFKDVAGLFSCYDSQMNPFRTTVSRLWQLSPAICYTLQSMAAACLADDYPHLRKEGFRLRREATSLLEAQGKVDDKSLLATLMLGQTASWHEPGDLGIPYFNKARKCLDMLLADEKSTLSKESNNTQFFQEALIYWEMLLSYVTEGNVIVPSETPIKGGTSVISRKVPHPWTGFARDAQLLVHEVGRLIRKERLRIRARGFTTQADIEQSQRALVKARDLEERLLDLTHPDEPDVVSPQDGDTPVWHLLALAEVYRRTGLIQIYRAFPDLLQRRLPTDSPSPSPDINANANLTTNLNLNTNSLSRFSTLFSGPSSPSTTSGIETSPWLAGLTNNPPSPDPAPSTTSSSAAAGGGAPKVSEATINDWLTHFALSTLTLLKGIPIESRTRCLQPFLLVSCSSELRLPVSSSSSSSSSSTTFPSSSSQFPSSTTSSSRAGQKQQPQKLLNSHSIEVTRMRNFVLGRLTAYLHILPPKPVKVCIELVRGVWERMDSGQRNVFWVDVMIENGWETTMG